jgi:hypothetical protein
MQPAARKGPIFIVGAMGSGTTLLRLVLDSHPHIAIPPETGFMRAYNAHRFIPFKWTGRNWAKRLGWSDKELNEQLRAFYDTLFMRYAEQHGKRRWGEKTPLHTWHIDAMARLFPDAVFVGVVRHPGGSVASNKTRWKHSLAGAASHYERHTKEILRQATRYPRRFALLRYEELVLRPEAVLRELLEWLGEPWSERVLEHHVVQSARGGREMVEGRNLVGDPIDVSRIDKWTRTLDPITREGLEVELGGLAQLLGYSIHDPAVLEPLNERGTLLSGGRDLSPRIDRFPDLGVLTRGEVPSYETLYHPREHTLVPAASVAPALPRRLLNAARASAAPAYRRLSPTARGRVRSALRRVRG